jgi:hypothetical protein
MLCSSPDGSIDEDVMNDGFGSNAKGPREDAKSDGHLARHAEPPLDNNDRRQAHGD